MKTCLSSTKAPHAIGPYSQAVAAGDFIFCSGQIPLTVDGTLVEGDIVVQSEQVFQNIQGLLEDVGSSLDKVVKTTVFLKNIEDYPQMNEVYAKYFSANCPARSAVEVARLPKDVLVEIEVIALK